METLTINGRTINLLTDELIAKTYKEAERTGLYDWWDCSAYVIDKLLPENERTYKPDFYHHVYLITDMVREYVNSTYENS